jgi:hypothetical protein
MFCRREHCPDEEGSHLTATIRSVFSHSITHSLEHFKVNLPVNSLNLWYEFKVDEPFDVKGGQHVFHISFDLPRFFGLGDDGLYD